MSDKKTNLEKKKDLLDIIEDASSKEDFIHWILNHTDATITNTEEWIDIKKKLIEDKKVSVSILRDYSITLKNGDDVTDALESVQKETDKAKEVVERLSFTGHLAKFAIAIGGVVLFLGLSNIVIALLIFLKPEFLNIINDSTLITSVAIFLGLGGIIQVIGGLLLMTK